MIPAEWLRDLGILAEGLGELQAKVSEVQFYFAIIVEDKYGEPFGWLVDEVGDGSWFFTQEEPVDSRK